MTVRTGLGEVIPLNAVTIELASDSLDGYSGRMDVIHHDLRPLWRRLLQLRLHRQDRREQVNVVVRGSTAHILGRWLG